MRKTLTTTLLATLLAACSRLDDSSDRAALEEAGLAPTKAGRAHYIANKGRQRSPKWATGKWLGEEGAETWCAANASDKVSTCGNIIAGLHNKKVFSGSFAKRISDLNDIRVHALLLAASIDEFYSVDGELDPETFWDMDVATVATLKMYDLGWIER